MLRLVFGVAQHTTFTKWSSAHAHGRRSRQSRADNERQRAHTAPLFPSFTRREFQSILIFIYFLLSVSLFFLESAHSHSDARVRTHANGSPFSLAVKVGPKCKRVEFLRGHRRNAIIPSNLKLSAAVGSRAHRRDTCTPAGPNAALYRAVLRRPGDSIGNCFAMSGREERDMIKRVENR